MTPGWAKPLGVEGGSLAELAANPVVVAAIERAVEDVMVGFNQAERVKKGDPLRRLAARQARS